MQNLFNYASAGSDTDPGVLDSIIKSLEKIKKQYKKFSSKEEVSGTVYESVVNEASISMYKSMVQNVLKDLDVVVKQSDIKVGTKKSDSWLFVTLNGHVLCSDTAYDQMVAWAKAAIKEDPAKYGLPTSLKESEELNESAIEIAGGIILGIVGLKVIGGIAKGLFGTLKLKAMKDPEKLKELAKEIASRAMEKNPLKAALWLTAVKGMIDKGDIKDGFGLLKTAAKMDSMDIKKVFEAEGFDFSGDVNEAEIKNAKDFEEYAMTVLKKQHGDDFDEKTAKEVIKDLSAEGEKDGDWGAVVGKLNA
jgi:hypothetical protein